MLEMWLKQLYDNPLDKDFRLVFADFLDENGDPPKADRFRQGLIPLWPFDMEAATRLGGCRFSPGTWDKKMARTCSDEATERVPCLTPRQYLWMWILVRRYRRQIRSNNEKHSTQVLLHAEAIYQRYYELHEADLKHPEFKLPGEKSAEPKPSGSAIRERNRKAKLLKESKQIELPLFD